MKKYLMIILLFVVGGGAYYTFYSKSNSTVDTFIAVEKSVSQVCADFKDKAVFSYLDELNVIEKVNKGEIKIAYGEFFEDTVLKKNVRASKSYSSVSFFIGQRSDVKTPKRIGYVYDFTVDSIKKKNAVAELVKFPTTKLMMEAIKAGHLDAVCLSGMVTTTGTNLSFTSIDLTKKIVLI
ncbi:MAG: hypothetical protein ACK5XN_23345, partial [Bacteroidota bacterium]